MSQENKFLIFRGRCPVCERSVLVKYEVININGTYHFKLFSYRYPVCNECTEHFKYIQKVKGGIGMAMAANRNLGVEK